MKTIVSSLIGFSVLIMASSAMAQMMGEGGVGNEGHGYGYGMMGGYMAGWIVYGLIKAGVVVTGLWLLLRIARATERIAGSKS